MTRSGNSALRDALLLSVAFGLAVIAVACSGSSGGGGGGGGGGSSTALVWDQGSWDQRNWQ